MAIVIDPKKKIEVFLESWDYLPFNPQNDPNDTYKAIIKGAAYVYNELIDIDFESQGYCWASTVTRTSLMGAIIEAVDSIGVDLACDINTDQSTKRLILNEAHSLIK